MAKIEKARKRDGRIVPFDERKIANAIFKAARAVGGEDRFMAEELASVVTLFLEKEYEGKIPTIEEIQDIVEKVLIETGHAKTAKVYILYRDKRARMRQRLQVRKTRPRRRNTTDLTLLVDPGTKDELLLWSKSRIVDALLKEADLDLEVAESVGRAVERRVFDSGLERISTAVIRALVDNELFDRGLAGLLEKQNIVGMPKYDLKELIFSKSRENSNIAANNPEAINLTIAENTLKQFALQEIFSPDVAEAHMKGFVHLHDLGYPTRVYCSSHSLEYLKKYGLSLGNLDTASAPAKHARTLTGHLNTFLASMQAYYAGALGVGHINILYAPYLEGMPYREMKQEAQHLIFSGSQSAFSRGGQTLFLDFNVHTGVPSYLASVPAIGPGGKYNGRTYADYDDTARQFTKAMLEVWREGDACGHIFAFPKCDLHINDETFADPRQRELLEFACQVASENGVPYFVFDRDEVTLSACCRLRTKIEDDHMIRHPESMRFCGFQNVTVNLPQCAYRAGRGDFDRLYNEIDRAMDIALKAHLQKRNFIRQLMSTPEMPLWEIGKSAMDGRPYVDLDASTYIIGLIGLNECLQFLVGRELHEGDDVLKMGLKIISYMNFKAKELGGEHGLKISLEESPAESASRRLAKVDMRLFPEAGALVKGDRSNDEYYYTNSVHLRASAPVDLITRITAQAKFHPLIESGAIIHAFVGEERPSWRSIFNLVRKTYENTQAAQLTISPEFSLCAVCGRMTNGLVGKCVHCSCEDVRGASPIAEEYGTLQALDGTRIAELAARHPGHEK